MEVKVCGEPRPEVCSVHCTALALQCTIGSLGGRLPNSASRLGVRQVCLTANLPALQCVVQVPGGRPGEDGEPPQLLHLPSQVAHPAEAVSLY